MSVNKDFVCGLLLTNPETGKPCHIESFDGVCLVISDPEDGSRWQHKIETVEL